MKTKYVHYGSNEFNQKLFSPIRNESNWVKPFGGLWASPIDADYSWKDFVNDGNTTIFNCDDECKFIFTLSDNANILYIDNTEILDTLPKQESIIRSFTCLDFEQLVKDGYDAIEFKMSGNGRLYWALYGWDCDCILIMNPDIIQIE